MAAQSNPRAVFKMSSEHAKLTPPSGRPLIIHVVVNIEYWAYDQPTPRTIVVPPHGRSQVPPHHRGPAARPLPGSRPAEFLLV